MLLPKPIAPRRPCRSDVFKRPDIPGHSRRRPPVGKSHRDRGRRANRVAGISRCQGPALRARESGRPGVETGQPRAIEPSPFVSGTKLRAFARSFHDRRLFAARRLSGVGGRAKRRNGRDRLHFILVGFWLFLLTIAFGHVSLLLCRLDGPALHPTPFTTIKRVRRALLYISRRQGRSVRACQRSLKKWSGRRVTSSDCRRTASTSL
jgi:hypothetical protein